MYKVLAVIFPVDRHGIPVKKDAFDGLIFQDRRHGYRDRRMGLFKRVGIWQDKPVPSQADKSNDQSHISIFGQIMGYRDVPVGISAFSCQSQQTKKGTECTVDFFEDLLRHVTVEGLIVLTVLQERVVPGVRKILSRPEEMLAHAI